MRRYVVYFAPVDEDTPFSVWSRHSTKEEAFHEIAEELTDDLNFGSKFAYYVTCEEK